MSRYVLVCFDDGDTGVFDYVEATDTIEDLATGWKNRITNKHFGDDKQLLIKMAGIARHGEWAGKTHPLDYTKYTD